MRRIWAMILVFALCLSFAACGKEAEDPNAGLYICTTAEMMGMEMPISEIYSGENKLELQSGGKGSLTLEDDTFKVKWNLEGTELTVTIDGEDSVGTLKKGVIKMDFMNMGLVLTFVKEGAEANEADGGSLAGSLKDKLGDQEAAPEEADVAEKPAPESSELGLYYGTTYAYNDQVFNMTEIYNSLCSIELQDGGKAVFILGEETMDSTWKLDGETFVLTNAYVDSPGTLQDGVITIDFMGMGMVMTFVKDGEAAAEAPAETPAEKPAETPAETPATPKKSTEKAPKEPVKTDSKSESCRIDEFYSGTEVSVNLTIPGSMWHVDCPSRTMYVYNVESLDVAHSASPRIQFELQGTQEQVDTYMKDATEYKELDSRVIGGVEMAGRTYKLWGMVWTEYCGELPNGLWMTVKISKVSLDAGSEGSNILDSVTFA